MAGLEARILRSESTFRASDGLLLARRSWACDAALGRARCITLVHGFGEHSGRYDEMAAWFARRGFSVDAFDHRGHGRSEGRRNYVGRRRGIDEYVDDAMTLIELVAAERAPDFHVLIGHSMGGLVVARALISRAPRVTCAVLSGAALAVSPAFSPIKQWLAHALARIAPTLELDSGLPAEGLSRDPEVVRRYESDPLVCTRMTASLAASMLAAQRRVAGGGSLVRVPLLGLHGGSDPICPPAGTQRFMEDVAIESSVSRVYPELRHEIFNEPERAAVWQDVLDFAARIEASVENEELA